MVTFRGRQLVEYRQFDHCQIVVLCGVMGWKDETMVVEVLSEEYGEIVKLLTFWICSNPIAVVSTWSPAFPEAVTPALALLTDLRGLGWLRDGRCSCSVDFLNVCDARRTLSVISTSSTLEQSWSGCRFENWITKKRKNYGKWSRMKKFIPVPVLAQVLNLVVGMVLASSQAILWLNPSCQCRPTATTVPAAHPVTL